MRSKTLIGAVAITLALALSACSGQGDDMSGANDMKDDTSSSESSMMAMDGTFEGLNDKSVEGTVSVSDSEITLADFSSDEGPDLHLYLANGTDEDAVASGVELGTVAFDEASQTFTIESDVNVEDYTTIVVHCDKAKAVFGAAELM